MACRRPDAGEEARSKFENPKGTSEVIKCDLADLDSGNAGMVSMKNEPVYTKDGFEITWATSYFGHFLMTELLLDTLKNTAPSRIAILSSVVHANSPKERYKVEDLHYKNRAFNNFDAYGEAKVANVLYAKELAERLEGTGVTTASIHPGWARSNFGKGVHVCFDDFGRAIYKRYVQQ